MQNKTPADMVELIRKADDGRREFELTDDEAAQELEAWADARKPAPTPTATGTEMAKQLIKSAITYAMDKARRDCERKRQRDLAAWIADAQTEEEAEALRAYAGIPCYKLDAIAEGKEGVC